MHGKCMGSGGGWGWAGALEASEGQPGARGLRAPHSPQAEQPQRRVLAFLDLWHNGMTLPCSEDRREDFERREPAAGHDGKLGGQLPAWKVGKYSLLGWVVQRGAPWARWASWLGAPGSCRAWPPRTVHRSAHGGGCEHISKCSRQQRPNTNVSCIVAGQHTPATQSPEICVLFSCIYVYYRVQELCEFKSLSELY